MIHILREYKTTKNELTMEDFVEDGKDLELMKKIDKRKIKEKKKMGKKRV